MVGSLLSSICHNFLSFMTPVEYIDLWLKPHCLLHSLCIEDLLNDLDSDLFECIDQGLDIMALNCQKLCLFSVSQIYLTYPAVFECICCFDLIQTSRNFFDFHEQIPYQIHLFQQFHPKGTPFMLIC